MRMFFFSHRLPLRRMGRGQGVSPGGLWGRRALECDRGIPDALRQTNNYNKIPAKQGTVSERRKHLFITSGVSGHRGDYVEKQAGLEGERVWRVSPVEGTYLTTCSNRHADLWPAKQWLDIASSHATHTHYPVPQVLFTEQR